MEQKNPVYVRMDYNESLDSKKDVLNAEVSLLNLIRSLKNYHSVRLEEMKIKAGIYKAIRELNLTMKKTKSAFPFFKIPEVKSRKEIPVQKEIKLTREKTDNSLESELREIQERLASLNR